MTTKLNYTWVSVYMFKDTTPRTAEEIKASNCSELTRCVDINEEKINIDTVDMAALEDTMWSMIINNPFPLLDTYKAFYACIHNNTKEVWLS